MEKHTKRVSIRFKLLAALLAVAFFVIGTSYINVLQQRNVSSYSDKVDRLHVGAQALLQMKNATSELNTEIISIQDLVDVQGTQAEGSLASDKKYKILASLEIINKWKNEYKRNLSENLGTDATFIIDIDTLQSSITDSALEYMHLKEQGISDILTQRKYQTLVDSVDTLKRNIDTTITKEARTIQDSVYVSDISEKKATTINYIVSFLSVLAACILGIFLNSRIVGPVLKVRDAVIHIANGDLSQTIDVKTQDEIGDLSDAFNNMTKKLRESEISLGAQIKENEAKSTALQSQVTETEKSKKAILNLLEDIQEEKRRVEGVVVERTKELSSEKARLLASINSLSFGFIIADTKHQVLLKNKAIIDLFGLKDADEMTIDHISELLGARFDIKSKVELCLEDEKVCEIKEIGYKSKFFRGIIAPILTPEDSRIIGYVFLLEDITEARIIDQAKSEFVALASHQLRTPLSAMNWYTEMLISGDAGELNKEQKNLLDEIYKSSRRMSDLVGMLLNVSRIELGTFIIDPKPTNICELVQDQLSQLKLIIGQKQLDVQVTCEQKEMMLNLDAGIMMIVLQNLLSNTIKYTPEKGHIKVEIGSHKEDSTIVLSVRDDGYGIAATQQAKIFTKLFRADNIKTKDTEGNGLGLYMVKTMLEQAGCKIWFESKENEGTTFFVSIPEAGMNKKAGTKLLGELKS